MYDEPDDAAGLLYADLLSEDVDDWLCTAWLPEDDAFCLATVLLVTDDPSADFEADTLLLDVLELLMVPLPVLELEPMPLLATVRSVPVNTRSSL